MKKSNRTLRTFVATTFKFLIVLNLMITDNAFSQSFKTTQLEFERVRTAYKEKEAALKQRYKKVGFSSLAQTIYIRAFKESSELELWALNATSKKYVLIHTYAICAKSGELGPKRKEGDGQVPEGFYSIARFNPFSNYYLSLGVSYPNQSDRILGGKNRLGGDIFIHGDCVTIGCLPLTNTFIKELYVACVEAKNHGQKSIQVHIFPYRMSDKNHFEFAKSNAHKPKLIRFWDNIRIGYQYFENKKTLPIISVDKQGKYLFK
jgi:murein L,D-transpeptidase YafK